MASEIGAVPTLNGTLRSHNVRLPQEAQAVSGINILGRTIRSLHTSADYLEDAGGSFLHPRARWRWGRADERNQVGNAR